MDGGSQQAFGLSDVSLINPLMGSVVPPRISCSQLFDFPASIDAISSKKNFMSKNNEREIHTISIHRDTHLNLGHRIIAFPRWLTHP